MGVPDAAPSPATSPATPPAPVPSAAAPAPQHTPRLQMPVAPTTSPQPVTPPTTGNTAPATPGATPNRVFNARPVVQDFPPAGESETAPAPAARASANTANAAPAARPATPTARTTAATPPPPEPAIPEQIPEPAPPGDIPPPIPPVPPVVDGPVNGSVDTVAGADPVSEGTGTETAVWMGLLASALGVLGLGFLGALALRRRQVRRVDQVPAIERPKVQPRVNDTPRAETVPASPVVTHDLGARPATTVPAGVVTTASLADKPRVSTPEQTVSHNEQPVSPIRERSREASLAPAGAAVPLPRKAPESREEREALLDRMVAARPDRANPFHAPRARRRRARLILQSLGRKFENGRARIDLSQYPQNWPELQGNNSAAA